MITFANAKINIGLFVTGKRPDGYHNIETVFYPIKMYDVLEVLPADAFSFQMEGIAIADQGKNLCEKAYDILKADFDLAPLSIQLLKNIPIGAGLGGGSSDAAFVLKAINEMQNLGLDQAQLEEYAKQLGADCPFFIKNKPVFASGTGADFTEIDLDLSSYYIVLVDPGIFISTSEAYSAVTSQTPKMDLMQSINLPIQEWKYYIINDFELGLFEKYPKIAKLKNKLYEEGALFAAMTGSGSAVYGIFDSKVDLQALSSLGKIYYPIDL